MPQNTWGVNRVAQRKSGSMLFPLLFFISTCESFPSEGETNRGMSRGAVGSRSLLVSRGKLSSPFLAYPLSVRKSVIQVFHVIAHIASRHAARHTTKSEPPLRLHSPKRRTGVRAEKRSAADALFNACDNAQWIPLKQRTTFLFESHAPYHRRRALSFAGENAG